MKHRAIIGIEIATDEVRGAWVRSSGGGLQLAGLASAPMPPGGVDSEGMLSSQEVGDAVRRVCAQLDAKAAHVVVGITSCNLVARVMEIPPVPDSEVRAVLRGEMDHYRILPAGQSAFDFYRLPDSPDGNAGPEKEAVARVLMMGAEERVVSSYRAAVDASGLHLTAVEPGSIAVLRALYPLLRNEEAVATVILSFTGTDIFITQRGHLQFYRRIDTGVPELYNASAPISSAPAPTTQPLGGLLVAPEPEEDMPVLPTASGADSYNRQAISLLMTEVQRSIDYYIREYPTAGEKMLVRFSIDASGAPELFAVMNQYLRSEAELASAMDTLSVAPEVSGMVTGTQGLRYTVAVGLALRGAGGEYGGAPALDLGIGDRVIVERRMAPKAMVASAGASAVILLGTVLAALIVGNKISSASRTLDQTRVELKALTEEHAAKVARLERQKNLTAAIYQRDKPLREAIEFVSAAVARGACLTNLTIDTKGQIFLSGEAMSPRVVADLMDTINLSPQLEPIRLTNLMRVDPDPSNSTLKFDLQTGFLKTPDPAVASPSNATSPDKQGGS